MKSERRHQLQTNELANQTSQALQASAPYARFAVIGLIGVVLAAIILGVWHSSAEKLNATAWSEYYFKLGKPDEMKQVYEDFPSSSANGWALQTEADSNLVKATRDIYINRADADGLLLIAKRNYEKILGSSPNPTLKVRATYGLAQTYEAMGNSEKAVETYKQLIAISSSTPALTKDATERIDWIEGNDGKEFFAWFKDFSPAPAPEIKIPGNTKDLPATPDMKFNTEGLNTLPSSGTAPAPEVDPSKLPSLEPTAPAAPATPASPELPVTPPGEASPTPPAATPTENPGTPAPSNGTETPPPGPTNPNGQ